MSASRMKAKFECRGLASAWDGVDAIRARVREHGKLILHPKSQKVAACTIKNALLNQDVLRPPLVRLRKARGKMPVIDDVIAECAKTYGLVFRETETNAASKDAWTLRRMLSWLKRKAARKEIGKDPIKFGALRRRKVVPGLGLECYLRRLYRCMVELDPCRVGLNHAWRLQDRTFQDLLLLYDPSLQESF